MHPLHSGRAPGLLLAADAQGAGAPSTGAVIAISQAEPASPNTVVAHPGGGAFAGIHELSPWSMFLNADLIVKTIMVGLFLSLVTWTIFVGKFVELSSSSDASPGLWEPSPGRTH